MEITSEIIAATAGKKYFPYKPIITLQLEYPRFIHSEFMTHRVFSRNASSSRAIPVERTIQTVLDAAIEPVHWGKNKPGMQASEEISDHDRDTARLLWRSARDSAISCARQMMGLGVHKQVVNRILEPFSPISVVVTSTEWDNFLLQRDHPDAQPEIRQLARAIRACLDNCRPAEGVAHYPYVGHEEQKIYNQATLEAVSVARCARVSYRLHDGTPSTVDKDLALYNRLLNADPPHWSPFEHVAYNIMGRWDNYQNWYSLRKLMGDKMKPKDIEIRP